QSSFSFSRRPVKSGVSFSYFLHNVFFQLLNCSAILLRVHSLTLSCLLCGRSAGRLKEPNIDSQRIFLILCSRYFAPMFFFFGSFHSATVIGTMSLTRTLH